MMFRSKFLRNKQGATAIEFAIVAPVFFLLLFGIIEVGLTMFLDSSMNTGLRAAARAGIPKGYAEGTPGAGEIRQVMRSHMGGLYRDEGAGMDLRVYFFPSFNPDSADAEAVAKYNKFVAFSNDPKTLFDSANDSLALLPPTGDQTGAVGLYALRYNWGGFSGIMGAFLPDYVYATTIVRNEAFDGGSTP